MEYTVLIQPQRHGFTAMIPTLIVAQFRKRPKPTNQTQEEDDPWLAMAGMWRDDPTWDEYQGLIKKYRQRPRVRK